MKISSKTTITFSEEDVINLIKLEVVKQGYDVDVFTVNVKKNQWTEGHGAMEIDYEDLVLESINVTVTKKVW